METLCKGCKINISDRLRLCCRLCKGQYHIDCTSASKLYYLMSAETKINWKCDLCFLQPQKEDDKLHTPPQMNSPPPTFKSPLSSTPQDFVTVREKIQVNIPVENTFSILSSDEEFEKSQEHENCVLQRSCPELNINNTDEMKDLIRKLQADLASAEQEIENLLSKNFTLKKKNSEQENQIRHMKEICTSTIKNHSSAQKKRKSLRTTKLNHSLDVEQQPIEKIVHVETVNNNSGIATLNMGNIIERPTELKKNRVIILADEQGIGTQHILQELLGSKYNVFSFCKPGAKMINVLSSCKSEINTLTNEDYLIVIGFKNDTSPFDIKYLFTSWLNSIKNTNVLVCETSYNKHLNEKKLNQELKFICSNFENSNFVDMNFARYVPKRKYYTTYLCRNVLREILRMSNHRRYKQYMLAKSMTVTVNDACIQTDCTIFANMEPQVEPEKTFQTPSKQTSKVINDQFFRV